MFVRSMAAVVLCAVSLSAFAQGYAFEWLSMGMSERPANVQRVRWRTAVEMPFAFAEITPATPSPDLSKNCRRYAAISGRHDDYDVVKMYHCVTFDSLEPGRSYLYRIGDGGKNWSEWYPFTTAAQEAAPFRFIYISDVQTGIHDHYPRVARKAAATGGDAAFVMFTGDMTGAASEWEWNAFFRANSCLFTAMPVVAVPDSHEYVRRNGESEKTLTSYWDHLFSYPQQTPGRLLSLGNCWFDYQGCRFIMLNTRELEEGSEQYRKVLLAWLEERLAHNPNRWCVIGQHRPVYAVAEGRDSDRIKKYLKPLYDRYDVDLVLTGHDHIYARMRGEQNPRGSQNLRGPVYVVSVAGSQVYMPAYHTYVERMASNTQLFQVVSVSPQNINFKVYLATGELYDDFEIVKTGNKKRFIDRAAQWPEITDMPTSTWKSYTDEEHAAFGQKRTNYIENKAARPAPRP